MAGTGARERRIGAQVRPFPAAPFQRRTLGNFLHASDMGTQTAIAKEGNAMMLTVQQSYALLAKHGVFARECCDRCGQLLGALRFTRRGESGERGSRECRGDG